VKRFISKPTAAKPCRIVADLGRLAGAIYRARPGLREGSIVDARVGRWPSPLGRNLIFRVRHKLHPFNMLAVQRLLKRQMDHALDR
jgi:hypothetical protein